VERWRAVADGVAHDDQLVASSHDQVQLRRSVRSREAMPDDTDDGPHALDERGLPSIA
jgi:hypothetical protein